MPRKVDRHPGTNLGGAGTYALRAHVPQRTAPIIVTHGGPAPPPKPAAEPADETTPCPPHIWKLNGLNGGVCRKCGDPYTAGPPRLRHGKVAH